MPSITPRSIYDYTMLYRFSLLVTKEVLPLLGIEAGVEPFYKTVKKLHRWLFMVPDNPRGGLSVRPIIVDVTAMCMSLVLLTGVVNWCPTNKKMLKSRLKISTNKGFRRFVYDTHVSLGIYAFAFLFLMAVTGPVFSFGWYKQGMSKLFGHNSEKTETKKLKAGDKPTAAKENAFANGNMEQAKEQTMPQVSEANETKKDDNGKKSGAKTFLNHCTQASGEVGSQRYFMPLPQSLVASCLSAVTICGGRKGKQSVLSDELDATDGVQLIQSYLNSACVCRWCTLVVNTHPLLMAIFTYY